MLLVPTLLTRRTLWAFNLIGFVDIPCGSHTETLVPDLANDRLLIYNVTSVPPAGLPHCPFVSLIEDEPELYLITVFEKFVDAAEGERRRIAFEAHNQRTTAQLQAESGDRVKIRSLAGDMLLRELKFK